MNSAASLAEDPLELPLGAWHRAHGARMVDFAGYSMPIQYEGIMAEHEWTRQSAGLFDVSHMGQVSVSGAGATAALESLLPADLAALRPGRMRYSLLLAADGGILDDLMVTNVAQDGGEAFALVVNAANKQADFARLKAHLPTSLELSMAEDRALLALQGPEAAAVLEAILPGVTEDVAFMQATTAGWRGATLCLGRSGYTGEDGFEISLPADLAAEFANALVADARVKPIGLGARDSLRLEAGLPLHGHDITASTDPVSAGLTFALSKRRRAEGGFPGAERIAGLLSDGPATRRVCLAIEGRLPGREGAPVLASGQTVGHVTSGGFAPSLGHAIAMAYVDSAHAAPGTRLAIEVRNRLLDATVVKMPFQPHRYHRSGAAS